jgi:hypothetical protein
MYLKFSIIGLLLSLPAFGQVKEFMSVRSLSYEIIPSTPRITLNKLYSPLSGGLYFGNTRIDVTGVPAQVDTSKIATRYYVGLNFAEKHLHPYALISHNHALNELTEKSYNSLTDKPQIPAAQVNSDWNASSGIGQILNKPTIAGSNTGDETGTTIRIKLADIAAVAPATTGAMTVTMAASVITITPTGACTFNATGGVTGDRTTFVITTTGTTARVLTFGTNFKSVGTLSTGTVTGKIFTINFICTNGIQWVETSRTIAQ